VPVKIDRYSAIVRATQSLKNSLKSLELSLSEAALAAHYLDQCEHDLSDCEARFGSRETGVYRLKVKQARRQYWSAVEECALHSSAILEGLCGDSDVSGRPVGLGLPASVLDGLARLFAAGRAFRVSSSRSPRTSPPSLFPVGLVS
jgi:hypothetical protein